MTDQVPSNADIEKWVKQQPLDILAKLPDCTERHEAEQNIKAAENLAHRARERVHVPRADEKD